MDDHVVRLIIVKESIQHSKANENSLNNFSFSKPGSLYNQHIYVYFFFLLIPLIKTTQIFLLLCHIFYIQYNAKTLKTFISYTKPKQKHLINNKFLTFIVTFPR